MPEEIILRGKTASDQYETLNFGTLAKDVAFQLVSFELFPSIDAVLAGGDLNLRGAITRGKTTNFTSTAPDFNQPGLIANSLFRFGNANTETVYSVSVVDDLAYITQDLQLHVKDVGSSASAINWQAKFRKIKLSKSAKAVANYDQYTIFDE